MHTSQVEGMGEGGGDTFCRRGKRGSDETRGTDRPLERLMRTYVDVLPFLISERIVLISQFQIGSFLSEINLLNTVKFSS